VTLALAVVGLVVLALSFAGARHDPIHPTEQRVFRAINRLPNWLFPIFWPPMQLGNLVVGTVAGLAVAWWYGNWELAAGVAVATGSKLAIERVIRHRITAYAAVRQRPGTSEPGAIRRGGDVPVSGASFPSGHVILVAAIATVVANDLPSFGLGGAAVLVLLVMLGRVYVGAHNPLDVTCGLGAGLLIGGVVGTIL
jgi:undecaprenyl-diphosphatase